MALDLNSFPDPLSDPLDRIACLGLPKGTKGEKKPFFLVVRHPEVGLVLFKEILDLPADYISYYEAHFEDGQMCRYAVSNETMGYAVIDLREALMRQMIRTYQQQVLPAVVDSENSEITDDYRWWHLMADAVL